ncbi:MAG: ABC transporter permease [Actinomycetaceae bacterium]|nr:ABC transporter permease [Actinomycetaceae bacterium]
MSSLRLFSRGVIGDVWRHVRTSAMFWIAVFIVGGVSFVALFPSFFTDVDPHYCTLKNSFADPRSGHIFGFDRQGCDVFARTVYGAHTSLFVGVMTTLVSVVSGTIVGVYAGYRGGFIDSLLSRITDIFFSIPFILAAIVMMQLFKFDRTQWLVVMVISTFAWPTVARIVRSAVLEVKQEEYIRAAVCMGQNSLTIIIRHILPNIFGSIVTYAATSLGVYIMAEATLSFLGIGLPPDMISWGSDISSARSALRQAPSVLFFPSGMLALTVLGFMMLGDVLRNAFNVKTRSE